MAAARRALLGPGLGRLRGDARGDRARAAAAAPREEALEGAGACAMVAAGSGAGRAAGTARGARQQRVTVGRTDGAAALRGLFDAGRARGHVRALRPRDLPGRGHGDARGGGPRRRRHRAVGRRARRSSPTPRRGRSRRCSSSRAGWCAPG